jgi:hypothetical protein
VYIESPATKPVKLNQDGTPRKAYVRVKENPTNAKLTKEHVNRVIELYSKENVSVIELSEQFKVSRQAIYNVLSGTSWKQGKE